MNEDGVKISQLPVADALANGDVVAGVSEGVTKAFPVDLLKGQKGDPGAPGAPGPQGEPGEPGKPGKDGSDASVDVQQTTGNSTTAVMSQDATTKAIEAETTARETAVQGLQSSVEANASAISAETTAREGAISAEATAREGADSTLQTAVDNLATQVATDLQNYYTKTETDQMVSAIPKFAISVVETLPTENISDTTVYLVPSGEASPNMYVEWIYADGKWEELGTQTVDLTDYYTKTEADAKFALQSALSGYYTKTEADGKFALATSLGNYYTKTESGNLYVPQTRTVNGKALSANISLASSDVGAVPTTRTVNNKALSSNITLGAGDVGAVSTSSFTITSTGQSRANNLPTSVGTALASATSTSTQAKIGLTRTTLSNGTSATTSYDLPMATASAAGCVTGADLSRVQAPGLFLTYQSSGYWAPVALNSDTKTPLGKITRKSQLNMPTDGPSIVFVVVTLQPSVETSGDLLEFAVRDVGSSGFNTTVEFSIPNGLKANAVHTLCLLGYSAYGFSGAEKEIAALITSHNSGTKVGVPTGRLLFLTVI